MCPQSVTNLMQDYHNVVIPSAHTSRELTNWKDTKRSFFFRINKLVDYHVENLDQLRF